MELGIGEVSALVLKRAPKASSLTAFASDANSQRLSVGEISPSGKLLVSSVYGLGLLTRTLHVADFNSDGRLDVVSAGWSSGVRIRLADQEGHYPTDQMIEPNRNIYSGMAADFDHNGTTDLLFLDADTGCVLWYSGKGDGTFVRPACTLIGTSGQDGAADHLAIADFDGDSHLDFAYRIPKEGALNLYFGDGTGSFLTSIKSGRLAEPPNGLYASDLSGDGIPDLIALQSSSIAVAVSNGRAGFAPSIVLPTGANPVGLTVGDMNRDGKPDLVVTNKASMTFSVLLNESR